MALEQAVVALRAGGHGLLNRWARIVDQEDVALGAGGPAFGTGGHGLWNRGHGVWNR